MWEEYKLAKQEAKIRKAEYKAQQKQQKGEIIMKKILDIITLKMQNAFAEAGYDASFG